MIFIMCSAFFVEFLFKKIAATIC